MISIGIDEAGRGCWAGPLAVAAVKLGKHQPLDLNDSKKISPRKRQSIFSQLQRSDAWIGVEFVQPATIDRYGLTVAESMAINRLVERLNPGTTEIIIDGNYNYLEGSGLAANAIVKADAQFACVMAASIVAKVMRDSYMDMADRRWPQYGLKNHKGYGTEAHRQALNANKPIEGLHRFSFKPVKDVLLDG